MYLTVACVQGNTAAELNNKGLGDNVSLLKFLSWPLRLAGTTLIHCLITLGVIMMEPGLV